MGRVVQVYRAILNIYTTGFSCTFELIKINIPLKNFHRMKIWNIFILVWPHLNTLVHCANIWSLQVSLCYSTTRSLALGILCKFSHRSMTPTSGTSLGTSSSSSWDRGRPCLLDQLGNYKFHHVTHVCNGNDGLAHLRWSKLHPSKTNENYLEPHNFCCLFDLIFEQIDLLLFCREYVVYL